MKRLLHVSVDDLPHAIRFRSARFVADPTVTQLDVAP
jgi:hypothetical protein